MPSNAFSKKQKVGLQHPSVEQCYSIAHASAPLLYVANPEFVGITSYDVSLEDQTADVYADESLPYETVLEKIKKTGKEVKSGEKDGVPANI